MDVMSSQSSPVETVADTFGRPLRSLRLSVTDRCNLRCAYCMPEEDYVWLPREDLLSFEEMATLTGYFAAATGIITPYSSAGVKQVVSLVYVKSDGTTKVLWSVANGTGATARTVGSSFTPLSTTSETDKIAQGGCLVAAETSYSYKPLLGQIFTSALNLSHINYFISRYGATSVLQLWNTSLTSTACTTGS